MAKEKVCLAYSGGLDTSCILAWLIEKGYDVVCFMADVGQEEDFEAAKKKAEKIGAVKIYVVDLREEFVKDLCFPAIQCNAVYEGTYLLGKCQSSCSSPAGAIYLTLFSRNIPRPPRHRPCPNSSRPKRIVLCRLPWLHRKRQRSSPLRTCLLRSPTLHQSHRPLAPPGILQTLCWPQRPPRLCRPDENPRHKHKIEALEYGRESRSLFV